MFEVNIVIFSLFLYNTYVLESSILSSLFISLLFLIYNFYPYIYLFYINRKLFYKNDKIFLNPGERYTSFNDIDNLFSRDDTFLNVEILYINLMKNEETVIDFYNIQRISAGSYYLFGENLDSSVKLELEDQKIIVKNTTEEDYVVLIKIQETLM